MADPVYPPAGTAYDLAGEVTRLFNEREYYKDAMKILEEDRKKMEKHYLAQIKDLEEGAPAVIKRDAKIHTLEIQLQAREASNDKLLQQIHDLLREHGAYCGDW